MNLFKLETWSQNNQCERICEFNDVSEAFRYRHPKRCYTHKISDLLKVRVAHVSQDAIDACKHKNKDICPFEHNLINSYPSRPIRTFIRSTHRMHHASCAVVGSGQSASGHSHEIDAHDAVIRTNDSPVTPKYNVGSKITYRIKSCWPINNKRLNMCLSDDHWTSIWIGSHNTQTLGNRSHWKISTFNTLCPNYKGWGHCSIGLWAVAFAITHCDRINLYGFMPSFVGNEWQYSRYYQPLNFTKREGAHNYINEKTKLFSLHCSGRIRVIS